MQFEFFPVLFRVELLSISYNERDTVMVQTVKYIAGGAKRAQL